MPNQILGQESSEMGFDSYVSRGSQRDGLSRENQRLRLEKLILERQLKNIMDLIASNDHLESLFLQQVDQLEKRKRETYQSAR